MPSSSSRRPGGAHLLPATACARRRHSQRLRIERLKDKLGNRSNASAEIRLEEAFAYRVGDEGRGVATIIEMVVHTLDCVLGSAAIVRRAVAGDPRSAP